MEVPGKDFPGPGIGGAYRGFQASRSAVDYPNDPFPLNLPTLLLLSSTTIEKSGAGMGGGKGISTMVCGEVMP